MSAIADWWTKNLVDQTQNSLIGLVDENTLKHTDSRRSLVYTSRILWFFSELTKQCDCNEEKQRYAAILEIAYNSIANEFYDQLNGGLFWEVRGNGEPVDRSKKVYGHAFCIYGLVSYYEVSRLQQVEELAKKLFTVLHERFSEEKFGGFVETLEHDWGKTKEFRLSVEDGNYPKSMNAHLHVMEACSAYHRVWQSKESEVALRNSIDVFRSFILRENNSLLLFADFDWSDQSGGERSLGHEIEFSWLACEAAEVLGCPIVTEWARNVAVEIATHVLQHGMSPDGRIYESKSNSSVWWVQAEAIVGFIGAYQITGDVKFLKAADAAWELVKKRHRSDQKGLWTWHDNSGEKKYFAGPWKGPYHDGRAMLEGVRRMERAMTDSPQYGKESTCCCEPVTTDSSR